MTRAKYLRIIGYIELISSIVGIVVGFIYMIALSMGVAWALDVAGVPAVSGPLIFISWVAFLAACFFAPAVGVLFLSVADLLDQEPSITTDPDVTSAYVDSKIRRVHEKMSLIERDVEILKNPHNEAVNEAIDNDNTDNKEDNAIVEEKAVADEASSENKKKSYKLDTKVQFNDDYLIDGTQVKKGQTGTIVDILVSFAGRQYVVALDGSEDRVLAREGHFE